MLWQIQQYLKKEFKKWDLSVLEIFARISINSTWKNTLHSIHPHNWIFTTSVYLMFTYNFKKCKNSSCWIIFPVYFKQQKFPAISMSISESTGCPWAVSSLLWKGLSWPTLCDLVVWISPKYCGILKNVFSMISATLL